MVLCMARRAAILAGIGMIALAGGCASEDRGASEPIRAREVTPTAAPAVVPTIKDEAEFKALIWESDSPALICFYKEGCPACAAFAPTFDRLYDQYKGRLTIARFKLVTPLFIVTSKEIQQRYNVLFFPTVILIANRQEVNRWETKDHSEAEISPAIDEAIRTSTQPAWAK